MRTTAMTLYIGQRHMPGWLHSCFNAFYIHIYALLLLLCIYTFMYICLAFYCFVYTHLCTYVLFSIALYIHLHAHMYCFLLLCNGFYIHLCTFRWCLRKMGDSKYIDNICDIFDIFTSFHASRLDARLVCSVLRTRLISALVTRSGLVPPSECTITLHEVMHICDQIAEIGVPRVSCLYKFERMNHILKALMQNNAKGLSSIFKNFVEHERITMTMSLSAQNIDRLKQMSTFEPSNVKPKDMDHTLRGVFVDNNPKGCDHPIMYDIASSAITELHGVRTSIDVSRLHYNLLILNAAHNVEDERSLMFQLYAAYQAAKTSGIVLYIHGIALYVHIALLFMYIPLLFMYTLLCFIYILLLFIYNFRSP